MKTFRLHTYAKTAWSISLVIALCPLLTLAQTIGPAAAVVDAGLQRSTETIVMPSVALRLTPPQKDLTVATVPKAPASRKKMLFTGLALVGGGVALTTLSYGTESYRYAYCPGCRPVLYTTNYRETVSGGMYWGGIAAAAGGGTMVMFSLFKK